MSAMESPFPSSTALKRKRSPSTSALSASAVPPAAKSAKTSNQLSINYLARQSIEDLPLINKDDSLPNLLALLSAYSNILERHESLASNLGARPLGPILIKRFERCFDAPPKVVASHHKGSTGSAEDASHTITWLEVIEFARSHPGQFTLSTFSEGRRVCQFYYPQKQLRVQISEEDFIFINSGRCQELIPPLPIWEDEEKEVGTCDVLEQKLKELTNVADMVAARTRQLSHRLKGRRAAILERRAEGGSGTPAKAVALQTTTAPQPSSTTSGFVAVNTSTARAPSDAGDINSTTSSLTAVRNELMRHFESLPQNQGHGRSQSRHHSTTTISDPTQYSVRPNNEVNTHGDGGAISTTSSLSPVPPNAFPNESMSYSSQEPSALPRGTNNSNNTPGHRPSSSTGGNAYHTSNTPLKHNFSRPLPPAQESTQPFRPLCQAHMDSLPRGHRVLPPCDRCRRLRMDCVKNLTSCAGCTKKHARCHWRDVSRDELGALDHIMDSVYSSTAALGYSPTYVDNNQPNGLRTSGLETNSGEHDDSEDDDSNPLEDLEALGEKEEQMRESEEGLLDEREEGLPPENDKVLRAKHEDSVAPSEHDLARQDWEDSLRAAAQQSHFLDPKSNNYTQQERVQANEAANQSEESKRATSGSSVESQVASSSTATKSTTYEPVYDHEPKRNNATEAVALPVTSNTTSTTTTTTQEGLPPVYGGFRAVNESMPDAIATAHIGWRGS